MWVVHSVELNTMDMTEQFRYIHTICTHIHTCLHTHIYIYIHTHTYTKSDTYIHTYGYAVAVTLLNLC